MKTFTSINESTLRVKYKNPRNLQHQDFSGSIIHFSKHNHPNYSKMANGKLVKQRLAEEARELEEMQSYQQ
jgi:hypothetical protein